MDAHTEFSKIFLLTHEMEYLRALQAQRDSSSYSEPPANLSLDATRRLETVYCFIEGSGSKRWIQKDACYFLQATGFRITPHGERFLLYKDTVAKEKKRKDLRAWITLGIAILGAIVTILTIWGKVAELNKKGKSLVACIADFTTRYH